MKIPTIILVYFGIVCSALAKEDKLFLDKQGRIVEKERQASYYRIIQQKDSLNFLITDYYLNGNKYAEGEYYTDKPEYLNGVASCIYRHGEYTRYYKSGNKELAGYYERGAIHSKWTKYYDTTAQIIRNEKEWRLGTVDGTCKFYDLEGNLTHTEKYDNGKLLGEDKSDLTEEQVEEYKKEGKEVFTYVEQMPEPGYNVSKKLGMVLRYPKEAKERGIEGKAVVRFVVDSDGEIVDIECGSVYVHDLLRIAAVEAVSQFKAWKPGTQNGVPVKVYYNLPISFNLN